SVSVEFPVLVAHSRPLPALSRPALEASHRRRATRLVYGASDAADPSNNARRERLSSIFCFCAPAYRKAPPPWLGPAISRCGLRSNLSLTPPFSGPEPLIASFAP